MSFDTAWRYGSGDLYIAGEWSARPQRLIAGAAIAAVAFACTWTLTTNLAGPRAGAIDVSGTVYDNAVRDVPRRGDRLAIARRALARLLPSGEPHWFDPYFSMGTAPDTFAANAPVQPAGWALMTAAPTASAPAKPAVVTAQATPAAPPRPARAPSRLASLGGGVHRAVETAAADTRTIFEKLFGRPASPQALAYAEADTGSLGGRSPAAGLYDRTTAVYDITAHTVYLPDGTALEAHSGLGPLLDDPRHPDAKNRGVTPPTVYNLQLREAPFHGVEALRLIPEDEDKALGRTGLLAHTFMLGPNGDSNGCVSFRDYQTFLRAYKSHQITRLAVVTHLD
jgi:hypothetical protein